MRSNVPADFGKERAEMAESKRDYYEVLGVPKDADDATLKKHTEPWPKSIIRMQIRAIRRQPINLRRHRRRTAY